MKRYNLRLKYGTHFEDGTGEGGGGGEGEAKPLLSDWKQHLPEDIAGDKSLETFEDIGTLAKAFIDTKADVGRSIRIPGPDAGADDLDSFNTKLMEAVPGLMRVPDPDDADSLNQVYDKLGRPKAPSDYEIPEGLPDDEVGNTMRERLNQLKATAHEAGLTKAQFNAQAKKLVDNFNEQMSEIESATTEEQEKLKLDWGSGLESKYKSILDLAQQTGAPESLRDRIADKSLDAGTMKWLDSLVDTLSDEGAQMQFQGQQDKTRITPVEAEAQINEIMDRDEYWDPTSPKQKGLLDKVVELQKVVESGR